MIDVVIAGVITVIIFAYCVYSYSDLFFKSLSTDWKFGSFCYNILAFCFVVLGFSMLFKYRELATDLFASWQVDLLLAILYFILHSLFSKFMSDSIK